MSTVSKSITVAEQMTYTVHLNAIPDGKTVTPINDIPTWLKCIGDYQTPYTTLDEVLEDSTMLLALMSDNNAIDYLVRSRKWASNPGLVPTMTANAVPMGQAFTSNNANTDFWMFNGVVETSASTGQFRPSSGTGVNTYIGYNFKRPTHVGKVKIWITSYACTYSYVSFKVQGSNDGSNWTDVSPELSFGGDFITTAAFKNTNYEILFPEYNGNYIYFRILFTSEYYRTNASYAVPVEVQFYEHAYTLSIPEHQLAMSYIGANNYACETLLNDNNPGLIPVMTSATTPSGEVTSTTPYSTYYNWYAFDGGINNWFMCGNNATNFLCYEFPEAVVARKLRFSSGQSYIAASFYFQGSNDGTTWDDLIVVSGSTLYDITIPFNNDTAYKKYRLYSIRPTGTSSYVSVGIFQLYAEHVTWMDAICDSLNFEYVLTTKIPTMTSNTEPSGEASANSIYSSTVTPAWKAFDKNKGVNIAYSSTWMSANSVPNCWLQYEFPEAVVIRKVILSVGKISSYGYYSESYILSVSNDGTEFTDLETITVFNALVTTNGGTVSVNMANNTPYKYYRINCPFQFNCYATSQDSGKTYYYTSIAELELFGR